jgi:hypothetical protein
MTSSGSTPVQRRHGGFLALKAKLRGVGEQLRDTVVLQDLQGGRERWYAGLSTVSCGD